MRLILAAIMIALLTVPSAAQKFKSMGEETKQKDNGPPKKKNEDEGYKAAIERLPDQKFDPWRNMR
jgi:hypothetical protein